MTMASPLRGPESAEGGGFAAAHFLARRAGYGARKSGQAQACPRAARGAQTPAAAGLQKQAGRQDTDELAFDSHKKRENYKPRVVSRIK
jgi:hypothetical protein